ncbi:DUF6602 domain-containing protein [Paenibacillus sp. UMB4589-SE434]|uniref:DUF6602 domain-containing protein n=1 Tax=Paenibacillus sp. UMB4589-SE434 TaxID=3046314 RepID=UPI00254A448E|nr:DUF6602 domain-containing protein [Paenibacillus sp. UMB4589-SE434]MDK8180622.1 hypothetical protein [Paenibacillus sp. UMB4589-SE434]
MSQQKTGPNHGVLIKLVDNYKQMERNIVGELNFRVQHDLTMGSFREDVWKVMFEQMIPRKFSIEQSVFIIDSEGQVSNEVDLAIFDEQYTPYIFRYGRMKYIPIEAVAVVVQCKSTNVDEENLKTWTDSIDKLNTVSKSIVRMASEVVCTGFEAKLQVLESQTSSKTGRLSTQTATRPIKILCSTKSAGTKVKGLFDILIHPQGEQLRIVLPNEAKSLDWWYEQLNHYGAADKGISIKKADEALTGVKLSDYRVAVPEDCRSEVSLLSLTFQLNQLLMLINNPILFPHLAYVNLFQGAIQE